MNMKNRRQMAKQNKPTSKPSASLVPGTVTALYEFSGMPDTTGDKDTQVHLNATIGNDMEAVSYGGRIEDGCLVNNHTRTCYAIPNGGVTGRYVHLKFTPSDLSGYQFLTNGGPTEMDPLPQNNYLRIELDGSVRISDGSVAMTIAPPGTLQVGVPFWGTLDLGAVYTFRNFGCHPTNLNGCWVGSFDQLKLSV
jgi:hypothetical protein